MNPEQPPYQPQQTPIRPQEAAPQPTPAPKKGIILPIVLMAWPAAGIILAIILTLLSGMSTGSSDGELFGEPSTLQTVLNIISIALGGLSMAGGPISFIIGLVILIKRKK